MSSARQLDLFRNDEPLSDEEYQGPVFEADPQEVREELNELPATVRAAQTLPWDADRVGFWRLVFPQMSNWLPAEEARQLCGDFEAELVRLEAAEQSRAP
jgi:hypothetical protein